MTLMQSVDEMVVTDASTTPIHRIEGDDDDDEDDDPNSGIEQELPVTVRTTVQPPPHPSSNHTTIYLLSLVQLYQDIYQTQLQKWYTSMIWNITLARRDIQSRNNTSNSILTVHSTHHMINARYMNPKRYFGAQRRLYHDDDHDDDNVDDDAVDDDATITTPATTAVVTRTVHRFLQECDEEGIRSWVPSTTKHENIASNTVVAATTVMVPTTTTSTGLRQRKGPSTTTTAPPPSDTKSTTIMTTTTTTDSTTPSNQDRILRDPIQLLLLSSNGLLMSSSSNSSSSGSSTGSNQKKKPLVPSLQRAQDDAIQLVQCCCILGQLQTMIQNTMMMDL
jgi:hypothetical protein